MTPTVEDVTKASTYTPSKDKVIVAAAERAIVDYLVTLDKKHLLNNEALKQAVTFQIINPGDFLAVLRRNGSQI